MQESKIKEGLYMMGLRDDIFYLSWLITYALQVSPSLAAFIFIYHIDVLNILVYQIFNAQCLITAALAPLKHILSPSLCSLLMYHFMMYHLNWELNGI